MRSFFLFYVLSIFLLNLSAQRIYLGYPDSKNNLEKGDRIIVSIPVHRDARVFLPGKGIDQLVQFLSRDTNTVYRIEIYDFWGTEESTERYSAFVAQRLADYLTFECGLSNFNLHGCGNKYPIFLDEKNPNYKKINTRMEILVE